MVDLNTGIFTIQETGENVCPTVTIPAQPHSAARTAIDASVWSVLQNMAHSEHVLVE
jgi:hypothetical protein